MPFDPYAFLRRHGRNPKTTLTIKGHGTITVNGWLEDRNAASIAALLAAQEPTHQVLAALAAFVGNSDWASKPGQPNQGTKRGYRRLIFRKSTMSPFHAYLW